MPTPRRWFGLEGNRLSRLLDPRARQPLNIEPYVPRFPISRAAPKVSKWDGGGRGGRDDPMTGGVVRTIIDGTGFLEAEEPRYSLMTAHGTFVGSDRFLGLSWRRAEDVGQGQGNDIVVSSRTRLDQAGLPIKDDFPPDLNSFPFLLLLISFHADHCHHHQLSCWSSHGIGGSSSVAEHSAFSQAAIDLNLAFSDQNILSSGWRGSDRSWVRVPAPP